MTSVNAVPPLSNTAYLEKLSAPEQPLPKSMADQIRENPELAKKIAEQSFEDYAVQFSSSNGTVRSNTAPTADLLVAYVEVAKNNPDIQEHMISTIMDVYQSQLNPRELERIIQALSIADPGERDDSLIDEANAIRMRKYPSRMAGLASMAVDFVVSGSIDSLENYINLAIDNPDLQQSMLDTFIEEARSPGRSQLTEEEVQDLVVASSISDPEERKSELQRIATDMQEARGYSAFPQPVFPPIGMMPQPSRPVESIADVFEALQNS
ncbi:MAG: hypothetical protein V3U76_15790 [Granulosicoccus sp.]